MWESLQSGARHSYGPCLPQDTCTHPFREVAGRQYIDSDSKQLFKLDLKAAQIEQGCSRQGINQQVQIAAFVVFIAQNGAEYPRVAGAKAARRLTDRITVFAQRSGGLHA